MMITTKQIRLMKLIYRRGEISAKEGRRIYCTYAGLFSALGDLRALGFITSYVDYITDGNRRYQLTSKGERFIIRYP